MIIYYCLSTQSLPLHLWCNIHRQAPLLFFSPIPLARCTCVICRNPTLRGICWYPMLGTICHSHTLGWCLSGSSLSAFVHSKVWMCGLEMLDMLGGINSNTQEIQRHRVVMGGQPRNTEPTHIYFIWSLNTPTKKVKKQKTFFYCDARNKQSNYHLNTQNTK